MKSRWRFTTFICGCKWGKLISWVALGPISSCWCFGAVELRQKHDPSGFVSPSVTTRFYGFTPAIRVITSRLGFSHSQVGRWHVYYLTLDFSPSLHSPHYFSSEGNWNCQWDWLPPHSGPKSGWFATCSSPACKSGSGWKEGRNITFHL